MLDAGADFPPQPRSGERRATTSRRRSRIPTGLDRGEAQQVAYDLLSRKAWTRRELFLRLLRRGAPAPVAEEILKDLEQQGYVNDQAFAIAWAETRARERHWGGRRLRQELARKGVAPPAIERAIEKAFGPSGEEAEAVAAATHQWPRLLRRGAEKAPRRLRDYLLRRGFSAELVEALVKQIARLEM